MKLVLLDIDGTILLSQGSGRGAMAAALEAVLGRTVTTEGVSFSGRTDRQIIREILQLAGANAREDEATLDAAVEAYLTVMPQHLDPARVTVMPGIPEFIHALHEHQDVVLGLLTGNLKKTAYLKLAAVGLDGYFVFGAFGSDHEDRNLLPPVAIARAEELTGYTFDPGDVYVIGDTVHDVTCGRVCGCRTVAVCTGRYTRSELADHGPDLLVDDFSDYGVVVDFICGSPTAA